MSLRFHAPALVLSAVEGTGALSLYNEKGL
jgi:hypothetical protein